MQWFRVYTEVRHDPKLKRLARDLDWSVATAVGVWVTVLAIAGESPTRGVLLLAPGVPADERDLEDAADVADAAGWISAMVKLDLLGRREDGALFVTHWSSRQFVSDDSAPRVKAARARARDAEAVTAPDRYSNGPETEAEAEAQAETDAEDDDEQMPAAADSGPAPVQRGKAAPAVVDSELLEGVVLGKCRALGITEAQAHRMLSKCGEAGMAAWLEYVEASPGLKNPAAFLQSQAMTGAKAPAVPKGKGRDRESSAYAEAQDLAELNAAMRSDPDLCKRILKAPATELERKAGKRWREIEAERRALDKEIHEVYLRMVKDPALVERIRADDLRTWGESGALERWDKVHEPPAGVPR